MLTTNLTDVCTLILAGATRMRLYGSDHRLTRETVEALYKALGDELAGMGELRITLAGDEVLASDERLDATSGAGQALVARLGGRGIALLEIYRGLQVEELETFLTQLGASESSVTSQPHLVVGAADIPALAGAMSELDRVREHGGTRDTPVKDEVKHLAGLVTHVRDHHEVKGRDARDIVITVLSGLSRQRAVFLSLAEVREHNLFTYLHTCNVVTLAMGFAMALGQPSREVFEIGTAALLHDLGKNFIPKEVLDKPGKLDAEEWELVRLHPWVGARLLMRQRDVPHLAVVAAYEHHMHWSGGGGYPKAPFRPSRVSQLIAVVDSFDALFGRRSYHAPLDIVQALEVLQSERGRMYEPELVDAFSKFVTMQMEIVGVAAVV